MARLFTPNHAPRTIIIIITCSSNASWSSKYLKAQVHHMQKKCKHRSYSCFYPGLIFILLPRLHPVPLWSWNFYSAIKRINKTNKQYFIFKAFSNSWAEKKTSIPAYRLLQDLVETNSECVVVIAFLDEILVNPELCRCDGLSLRNTREVKAKFLSVLLVQKILILVHYQEKTDRW